MKELIHRQVSFIEPEIEKLALDIYNNPELGNEEIKACNWQVELLEKYGFNVEKGFCDIPTAYKAVYEGKKKGPKIATLAEYDALPVLGHGCGHNLIAAIAVGTGIVMRDLVDEYGGSIYVIGTPAEETQGAKVEMTKKGAFDEIDLAMMAHPAFKDAGSINTIAVRCIAVEFFGKPAHASSSPHLGVNALDAMINFFNMVNAMRQQTTPDSRIHGVILEGGVAPNVIPDYTKALFYVRANKMSYAKELEERVSNCAKGAALGTGCEVKITKEQEDFKDTCSNRYLSHLIEEKLRDLGHDVMNVDGMVLPGSSDLGDVSYVCPSVQLTCSMSEKGSKELYSPHTEEFAKMAGTKSAIKNAMDFIEAFNLAALDILTDPRHLESIKKEFETVGQISEEEKILPL